MMCTIEFFRIRKEDNARAMLDRITHIASDLESSAFIFHGWRSKLEKRGNLVKFAAVKLD